MTDSTVKRFDEFESHGGWYLHAGKGLGVRPERRAAAAELDRVPLPRGFAPPETAFQPSGGSRRAVSTGTALGHRDSELLADCSDEPRTDFGVPRHGCRACAVFAPPLRMSAAFGDFVCAVRGQITLEITQLHAES